MNGFVGGCLGREESSDDDQRLVGTGNLRSLRFCFDVTFM